MNLAATIFPGTVINRIMVEARAGHAVVAAKFIRENRCALFNAGNNVRNKGFGFHVRNGLCLNVGPAFQDRRNGSLASRTASAFAGPFAADVSFVGFDYAFKQIGFALHELTNLMVNAPSRFVGNARLPHEFHCGNPVTTGGDKEHGMEPSLEGSGRLVKDGASRGGNLMAAPRASKGLAPADRVKAICLGALFASATIGEPLVKDILQTNGIVRKLLIKIFNRIFHAQTIYHQLLVVKG